MATLEEALAGLNYTGADTGYGIAAQTLNQMTPQLINPYGSTGQAVGIGLGSILLQSLLGYQARQQASQDTLELNSLANQLMKQTTPEARTEFIGGVSDPMYQGRLSTLSTALMQQEATRKAKAAEQLLNLETAANFELSPLGQQIQEQKTKQSVLAAGIASGNIPSKYANLFDQGSTGSVPLIPGLTPKQSQEVYKKKLETQAAQEGSEGAKLQKLAVGTVRDLEQTFRNLDMTAAEFKARSLIPGDPAELAYSKLKGSLAALARVSGQTSQLSDTDLRQQLDAVIGPKIPVIGMISGTESIADRIADKLKTASQITETSGDSKMQKLQQLQEMLAELKRQKAATGR
jgi:hypothetical protein